MSYNVAFKVKVQDTDIWWNTGLCDANITWNLREMILAATGLEWRNEANNGRVADVIARIRHGYEELVLRPQAYAQYEAPNGWGTVSGCKRFFQNIIAAYENVLEDWPALAPELFFWIE